MLLPKIFPVTCHTDRVGIGSTFVAIRGFSTNGCLYIHKALEQGASRIIVHHDDYTQELVSLCKSFNASLVRVDNTRQTLALEAAQALGNPAKKLKIIGITGTKGKTTTTYLTEYVLRTAGYKTALTSTIINKILDHYEPSNNATPDSDYLHMFFAECVKQNVEYVVMEISSHAISLDRIYGIEFSIVTFLNLMLDHLDFHTTMDEYFSVKAEIFSRIKSNGTIIVNLDHEWGEKAYAKAVHTTGQPKIITLSTLEDVAKTAQLTQIQTDITGISFCLSYNNEHITLKTAALFGAFNAYNISLATLIGLSCGLTASVISTALARFDGVPGRLQHHALKNGAHAFVDYAHNAGSVYEVLSTLRQHTNHLIVVFGCGGNKDPRRRPGMGASAALFADVIILTNDNPRNEDPQGIINDIINGIPEHKHNRIICQPDRRKAIALAVALAQEHSIIALLGKGHENYYIEQGAKIHFDDFEEICFF